MEAADRPNTPKDTEDAVRARAEELLEQSPSDLGEFVYESGKLINRFGRLRSPSAELQVLLTPLLIVAHAECVHHFNDNISRMLESGVWEKTNDAFVSPDVFNEKVLNETYCFDFSDNSTLKKIMRATSLFFRFVPVKNPHCSPDNTSYILHIVRRAINGKVEYSTKMCNYVRGDKIMCPYPQTKFTDKLWWLFCAIEKGQDE